MIYYLITNINTIKNFIPIIYGKNLDNKDIDCDKKYYKYDLVHYLGSIYIFKNSRYEYPETESDASYSSNSSFLWLFFIPIFSSYLPLYQEFHQHLYCLPNYYQNFLLQRIIHDSPQHFMV